MRQIIAVDIDDVIAAGSEGFAEFSNQRWGTHLTASDYDEDFTSVWGLPLQESLQRVDEYLASGVHGRLRHFDDASPILQKLAERFELIVVTSRRSILKPETDAWIERHFPAIFSRVVYAGIFDQLDHDGRERLQHTKAEILRELKATYLIDDQPKHCLAAAEAGVTSLLFGEYRWNREVLLPSSGVTRVKNWQQVGEFFDGQS